MASSACLEKEKLQFTILRIQKKINEGSIDNSKIMKYLRFLSHANIDVEMLKETSIGKTINTLRKEDGKIGEKARNLIIKWKDIAASYKPTVKTDVEKSGASTNKTIKIEHSENMKVKKHSSKLLKNSCRDVAADHESLYEQSNMNDDLANNSDDEDFETHNTSFADMLNMPMEAMHKQKKLKKKQKNLLQNSKISVAKLPELPTTLDIDTDVSSEQIIEKSTINTLEIKPSKTTTGKLKNLSTYEDDSAQLHDIVSRRTKSHMYSGKKNTSGVVTSLYQQAMRVLIENIDLLDDTGGVPFSILKPLLSKCNPYQLQRLEQYNPHFVLDEESDELWKAHCYREFKNQVPDEMEQWRELYQRLCEEREVRLRKLSSKITAHQAAKVPERSVKLAYVASRPNVHAKKNASKTPFDSVTKKRLELKEKLEKEHPSDAVAVPFTKVPRRDRCSFRPPSSLSHGGSMDFNAQKKAKEPLGTKAPSHLMPATQKKPAKKPMMAAAMKLMKKQHGRMTSQIIRR